jgi:hypothetical protein
MFQGFLFSGLGVTKRTTGFHIDTSDFSCSDKVLFDVYEFRVSAELPIPLIRFSFLFSVLLGKYQDNVSKTGQSSIISI